MDKKDKSVAGAFISVIVDTVNAGSQKQPLEIQENASYWKLNNHDGSITASITKRRAYPSTFCKRINDSKVCLGYGSKSHDEYLVITITNTGVVSVERDGFTVLPLFYHATTNLLVLSNEYADVVKRIKDPRPAIATLPDHLVMFDRYVPPPIADVAVLHEYVQLTFRPQAGATVLHPPDRGWTYSAELPPSNPKDFFDIFSQHLDHFVDTRLANQEIAFCVSGGLDSATLPQYFYSKTKRPIHILSMLVGPPYASRQCKKIQALAEFTHAKRTEHIIDHRTMAPLTGMNGPRYGETVYTEAITPLLRQLRMQGIAVLVTGDGGDELLHNVTRESFGMTCNETAVALRESLILPDFFTPAFHEAYLRNVPDVPISPLPYRAPNITYSQLMNNVYIREGIWPVSPFSSPSIYAYIQSIPAHFRVNKKILRAFHQAKGFAEPIYRSKQNEYFDVFFDRCFTHGVYDALFERSLQHAHSVRLGYVDESKIIDAYQRARNGSTENDLNFRLFCFMQLELSLKLGGVMST